MNLHPATPERLAVITATAADYRAMWTTSIGPPYPCGFDGSRDDIEALDFIGYEAGHHPRGLFGAALIWGNVLVKTGLLNWIVSDSGDYLLGSLEYPRFLLWPYARTLEIEHTSAPQFGKYEWLLEEAVACCLTQGEFTDEEETRLIALLNPERHDGFSAFMSAAVLRIRKRLGPSSL